jgi:hypothetical protein
VPHSLHTSTELGLRSDRTAARPRHRADSGGLDDSAGLPPRQRRNEDMLATMSGRHAGGAADRAEGDVSRACRTAWHVSCPQNWQDVLNPIVRVECACGCHARHRKGT